MSSLCASVWVKSGRDAGHAPSYNYIHLFALQLRKTTGNLSQFSRKCLGAVQSVDLASLLTGSVNWHANIVSSLRVTPQATFVKSLSVKVSSNLPK